MEVKAKVLDCDLKVSNFKFKSSYYVHFQTNTLKKGMESPHLPCYGLNSTTTVLLPECFWHSINNAAIPLNKETETLYIYIYIYIYIWFCDHQVR